ncbi:MULTISPECIES: NAD(P)/FAD-dependent oxidoreductase [Rhodococcus]|jgi:cation diffusion facilitator CzcD-associated flavoprotein CzcO|uniref:NAD(P)/FAD-dependent oxidoreductase n=1 Tax=Rhodococcus oxybenzonivorans TaxID=1990687 RepID=A0AAE4UX98_9NOCA|nr:MULTISPECIES: NAD(P)/FAD-dependent oxidoreductase [Rhodococcus]MDV7241670.1 NAD(P)/FAD-dependent oxidoreductase [Rhodococcus oxybenzonivorans]MDV7264720.1 NAD(P)/FAD-dependent oxidoreductase [Rhodococcus oxybenzonivorans]MDV7273797.1 NAD(P)/FAD-dependent oxidoreductase [Rhodococcus oxybenzonivorans]MDV7333951.1 NAD(P)/FAD-dependent oxidoreductase [Rhodococcus oxybenzonivorans]MDV7343370.1 NAD(P)/FAD-dependent oxidoreductase [Rhodococcus oxybenzonivorans]
MTTHHDVIVIGAGISGIAAAIKLHEAGVDDVLVLEKSTTFGGTWRANTYPGCACDVPSGLYSYSFAPNPDWSRIYGTQPEILAYVDGVARDNGLDECTRFDTEVTEAHWDEARSVWTVATADETFTARFLVAAAGPWNEPKIPNLPGLADFTGTVFHSAQWNHDHDLTGRSVAVVGSGASAVQFVPQIQRVVGELHLFQRTAHWVLPKPDRRMGPRARWAMRHLPIAHRLQRAGEYALMEAVGAAFRTPKPLMYALQALGRRHLRRSVPDPVLREKLTPRYLLGCKRILFSNNYLRSLNSPNVTVHAGEVTAVEKDAVIGSDGTRTQVDTLILGTGYHILDMPIAHLVHGTDGRSLAEHWSGSPTAYLGTFVTGFPNAFLLLGPSLGSGHTSAFTVAETQVALVVSAITAARDRRWQTLEVEPGVVDDYIEQVQSALQGTAYTAATCNSYFLDANGRNSFSWPWSTHEMTRRVGAFDPQDYIVTTSDREVTAS